MPDSMQYTSESSVSFSVSDRDTSFKNEKKRDNSFENMTRTPVMC